MMQGCLGFTGRTHSPETIRRLKELANRPEERERRRNRQLGRKHSPETIEKIRRAANTPEAKERARKAGLSVEWTPERRARHRLMRLQQTFPQKMTQIEQSLYRQFKKRRLKFEMHKTMFGRFQPDFVFEGVHLIVQADGDYWHRLNGANSERDARFNDVAHKNGWTVWRFAESEITMHPEACGKAVARFVRSH